MKFLYRHQPPVLTEDVFYADKEGMGTIIDAFAKIKEAYIKFKRINRDIIFNNEKFAADKSWKDLEDPNIPEGVKKGIREDKKQLEKIIYSYNSNKTDFLNRINSAIIEALGDKDLGELRVKERK